MWTPLHACTFQEHGPIVYILLERGANINAADTHRRTPVDFASASEIVWPHFAVLNCRKVNKKELMNRQIFSKTQMYSVIHGQGFNESLQNHIKFVGFQNSFLNKRKL